jgi:hypothetical protein
MSESLVAGPFPAARRYVRAEYRTKVQPGAIGFIK